MMGESFQKSTELQVEAFDSVDQTSNNHPENIAGLEKLLLMITRYMTTLTTRGEALLVVRPDGDQGYQDFIEICIQKPQDGKAISLPMGARLLLSRSAGSIQRNPIP
jgi:hypothetical protein